MSKVIHADIKPDNFMFKNPPVFGQQQQSQENCGQNKEGGEISKN